MRKQKCDPEFVKRVSEWDGDPFISLPPDYLAFLMTFVPRFHVCAEGPVPFGQLNPVHISTDDILVSERDPDLAEELALNEFVGYLQHMCEEVWNREWDPEEWDINHVVLIGGN